ncbi:MAG: hypothetical protein A2516_08575 [Alphaproteobacteria bacterium RIFOXYD12_FULL_60_8]|nr:MAG: hypothetical protein A2516_08575 [Alphaproteobacteria bacterium RIFOXYD12_FULL_60_8]
MSQQSFLVAGCGSMARRRIRHAIEMAGAKVAVWDIRSDRMEEVKALFPSVICLSNVTEMRAFAADGLFICVPPSDHEYYIKLALDRALPFMCEQPISHKLTNLETIRARVAELGLICHVSHNQRYSPRVLALKKVLDEGAVGKPLTGIVELGEWLPLWHPYEPYQDYYPAWRKMGGGLDAVCDLDWLRHLFGEPQRMEVMCSRKSALEIDTFDVTQFLLDFGDDGPQLALHLDMLQQPIARQSRIVCSNGIVVHNHPDQFHRVYLAQENVWKDAPFEVDLSLFPTMQGKQQSFVEPMYQGDTAEFLRRLAEGDASLDSLDNGIRNVRLVKQLVFGDDE